MSVDATAPTVSLAAVPSPLSGSVTLAATPSGGGVDRVVFQRSAAGADSWTEIATATASPWSVAFDSSSVGDGSYDVRAVVYDGYGNSSSAVRSGIRVDNTAPTVTDSTPADGSLLPSVPSVSVTASEDISAVTDVAVDGTPVAGPTISGRTLSLVPGALAPGDHAVTGKLVDLGGHVRPFRVNFTIWSGPFGDDVPAMAKNTRPDTSTSVTSADGTSTVVMPSGAYAWRSDAQDDWLVLRLKPVPPSTVSTAGMAAGARILDVTARWNLSGDEQHDFSQPLDILLTNTSGAGGVVAATWENGGWRPIPSIPAGSGLAAGMRDGAYVDSSGVHVLTRHLSLFTLLRDIEPPSPPTDFAGVVAGDGLTLRWAPGSDNSGSIVHYSLLVNGQPYRDFGGSEFEVKMGAFDAADTREFTMRESDAAGNTSAPTAPLVSLPPLLGRTLADAAAALSARGFGLGGVTYDEASTEPAGTVVGPADVQLRTKGAKIDLVVSGKAAETPVARSKLSFAIAGTKDYAPASRRYVAARISVSNASQVVATLYSPRHVRLYTWRLSVEPGATVRKLRMPKQVRRAGAYTLVWTARSADGQVVRRTQKLRVVGTVESKAVTVTRTPVEIVLAGLPSARAKIAIGIGKKQARVLQAAVDRTFELTAAQDHDVSVIVVDVDRYGLAFVRDLRTVFPSVRIVALSASARTREQAKRAGAQATLPRKAPAKKLTQTIRTLTGLK